MGVGRRALDDRRRTQSVAQLASREDRRAGAPRLLDPLDHAISFGRGDERADVGGVVGGIATGGGIGPYTEYQSIILPAQA